MKKFGEARRADIDRLLLDKVSDALNEKQKAIWIKNLLAAMRAEGTIHPVGTGKSTKWVLTALIGEPVERS